VNIEQKINRLPLLTFFYESESNNERSAKRKNQEAIEISGQVT